MQRVSEERVEEQRSTAVLRKSIAGDRCSRGTGFAFSEQFAREGDLRYSLGGVIRELRRGDWMHTPKCSVHGASNPFDKTARAVIILCADIAVKRFREGADIVDVGGPPDRAKRQAVMGQYGLVPAAPRR